MARRWILPGAARPMSAVCVPPSLWPDLWRVARAESRGAGSRHTPRARFSQNFLVDAAVVAGIIQAVHPLAEERLVEIGPGLGALTRPLLQRVEQLYAIEIDRDLAASLKREFGEHLQLHIGD